MSEHADFEMNVDLTGVDAWGGESGPPVPPGLYDLEIIEATQSTGKQSQQATLKIVFGVLNDNEYYGKKITKSYSLQPQSLGRVKNLLIAARHPLDGTIRSRDLVGKAIVAEVAHVQGQPKANSDGSLSEGKFFADVINERTPEDVEASKPAQPAPTQTQKAAVRRAVGQAKA